MKEVLEFLSDCGVFYLATTDGTKGYVRPLGFVMEWKGALAFCTSNEKQMYRQLRDFPQVEMSCVNKNMETLRISGKAVFCTSDAAQQKALKAMPTLEKMYAVGDGKFEIFILEDATALRHTMTGETRALSI